ncbi:MAG: fluoride efflux transporter CrcB [Gammaproteobacteria bacterium]|nr:fluoride efflux transporter CrcB [Gammaproteobacteria bacterium]|tara:strand:- start:103 stop:486 length:384 start_codon:yes stop_codon:yes gene_type:complete
MNQIIYTSLIIGLGGFIGTILRFLLSSSIEKSFATSFPIGTILVNLIGCFLIGLLSGYFTQKLGDQTQLFFFLTIGVLGGFTTFSAIAMDSQVFIENGEYLKMLTYISVQAILGIALCLIGYNLIKN